jgi:O-acetyl-ADP-ribose deacetylase (regulator of RNase III)
MAFISHWLPGRTEPARVLERVISSASKEKGEEQAGRSDASQRNEEEEEDEEGGGRKVDEPRLLRRTRLEGDVVLEVRHGDLTREHTEALVNAANSRLLHGGGVAGALARACGAALQRESDAWTAQHGPVAVGQVAVTGSGLLRERGVRVIIHAVGPFGPGPQASPAAVQRAERDLHSAALESMRRAEALGLASIAMPAISSGIFGFDKRECARLLFRAALDFAASRPRYLRLIRFTNFDDLTCSIFQVPVSSA